MLKISNLTNHPTKDKAHRWKGEDAGYSAKHIYIRKYGVKPDICSHCLEKKRLEWANISGKYLRELSDWIALCKKCHKRFDRSAQCPNGHDRISDNLYTDYRGIEKCRLCKREKEKRAYWRKKNND